MYEKAKHFTLSRPRLKKSLGVVLVVFGFFALVTPLTPGGLLFFVGLELLGLRFIFTDKIKRFFTREKVEVLTIERLAEERVSIK